MNKELRIATLKNELTRRRIALHCELARRDFYEYCRLTAPGFYLPERTYLKTYCNTLQRFYEGKLFLSSGYPAKRLMIQMPPRHGKTRTLTKFSCWLLGKNSQHKTIVAAYNDDLAYDFSKYARDEIKEEKNKWDHVIYNDIFPDTRIRRGSSSMKKWAVEGSHFSYRGAGLGGTLTGQGGDMLIIDDPVKDAETAFNEFALDKIWLWYTGTFSSRKEYGALEIITHTPWSTNDISGRILKSELAEKWYRLSMPARVDGKMLCGTILSEEQYFDLKKTMDPLIFSANYDLVCLEKRGMMYESLKTYIDLPVGNDGKPLCQEKMMFADTATCGEDYFCAIYGNVYNGMFYVTHVYFTQEDIDKTEDQTAYMLIDNKVVTAYIENNSAGHGIAYHINKTLNEKYNWFGTNIVEFTQNKNKQARIFASRVQVMNRIVFPADWRHRWPEFYNSVTTYSKIGKNAHDDGPDALTVAAEFLEGKIIAQQGIKHSVI